MFLMKSGPRMWPRFQTDRGKEEGRRRMFSAPEDSGDLKIECNGPQTVCSSWWQKKPWETVLKKNKKSNRPKIL